MQLFPRRRGVRSAATPVAERLLGVLQLGSRSALTLAIAGIMLVFIGLLLLNFVGQVLQSASLEARRAELQAEVAAMRSANEQLAGSVGFTESDVYVERVAREQLGYAREGDMVILPRLVAPAAPAEAAPAASPAELAPSPRELNWRLWWQALFPPA
jgi:cell division protein FtsB